MRKPGYAVGSRLRVVSSRLNAALVGKVGTVVRIRPNICEREEGRDCPAVYEMRFDGIGYLTAFDERQLTQEEN